MTRTWIAVAVMVAAALCATLVLDFTTERRPQGGWLYLCRVTQPVGGGTLAAVRRIGEHGEDRTGYADIAWFPADFPNSDPDIRVRWFARNGEDSGRLAGTLEIELRKALYVDGAPLLTLRRPGDDGPGLPARYASYRGGEFELGTVLAYAGAQDTLGWRYAGKSPEGPQSRSGTVPVTALRGAQAAIGDLMRRLDAQSSRYATDCRREPAMEPPPVIY